jgi:hypothetical protein
MVQGGVFKWQATHAGLEHKYNLVNCNVLKDIQS